MPKTADAAPKAADETKDQPASPQKAEVPVAPLASPAARSEQQEALPKPAEKSKELVESGKLPDVSVVQDRPLTPEEKFFTDFYQRRILNKELLSQITPVPQPEKGETPEMLAKRHAKLVEERAEALRKEMGQMDSTGTRWLKSPEYGPATQAAMKDFADYISKKQIPSQFMTLLAAGVAIPPGSPIEVPMENGRRLDLQEFSKRVLDGTLSANLGDWSGPPNQERAMKFEAALNWLNNGRDALAKSMLERYDERITEQIKTLGLPKGWLYQEGTDKNAWRVAVGQMIDLVTGVARSANLVDKLELKMIGLPPGARVTTGEHGSNVSLDLPQNLNLNDPETARKVRALVEWQRAAQPRLDEAREKLTQVEQNPYNALSWRDVVISPLKNERGETVPTMAALDKNGNLLRIVDVSNLKLDKDGRVIGVVDPSKPRPEGEQFLPVNLLEQRLSARVDPKTGEIIVNQNVQAQWAPWWSYENAYYENVGKPAVLPDAERRYKPDDIVTVNTGSRVEFMLARDLPAYAAGQAFMHYSGKILVAAMDAAMIATGTIEIGAAVKGARLLYAGAEVAGLTQRVVLEAALKGTWDIALGATGFVNSAGMQSTEVGRYLSTARNLAFLTTIAYGPLAQRFPQMQISNLWRGGEQVAAGVGEGDRAARGLGELLNVGRTSQELAQRIMMYSTVPVVLEQLKGLGLNSKDLVALQFQRMGFQLSQMWAPYNPYAVANAIEEYDRSRAKQPRDVSTPATPVATEPTPENVAANLEEARQALVGKTPDSYRGRDAKSQIDDIFKRTQHALSPEGTTEEREALRQELAKSSTFSPMDLAYMERLTGSRLTPEQIRDLMDPAKLAANPNEALRKYVENLQKVSDLSIAIAREIALLALARRDGVKDIGFTTGVAPHAMTGSYERGRRENVSIGVDVFARRLQARLDSVSADSRGIAVATSLAQVGAITPQQFGSVLQRVLSNPNATPHEKMDALSSANGPRMAALIVGLQAQERELAKLNLTPEETARYRIANFGVTSADFIRTLQTAANDRDPNVRALSAALLYGINRLSENPQEGASFLDSLSALKALDYDSQKGSFAADVQKLLLKQLEDAKPESAKQRVAIIESLAMLAKNDGDAASANQTAQRLLASIKESLPAADLETQKRFAAIFADLRSRTSSVEAKALAESVRMDLIASLKLPAQRDAQTEQKLIDLAGELTKLADGAPDDARKLLAARLTDLANNSPASYSKLQIAAIEAISRASLTDGIPTLESLAQSSKNASVRIAALRALESMHAPQLATLVQRRLGSSSESGSEADPATIALLKDIAYRNRQSSPDANGGIAQTEVERFQRSVAERYPSVQNFNEKEQKDWLQEKFPLLVRETFEREVVSRTAGRTEQQSGAQVVAERLAQFQTLIEMAQGQGDDALRARKILATIAGNGGTIGKPAWISVASESVSFFGNSQPYVYREQPFDFAGIAATTLAKWATADAPQRDMAALLISQALQSKALSPSSKAELLKAWRTLATSREGLSAIPESVAQSIANL